MVYVRLKLGSPVQRISNAPFIKDFMGVGPMFVPDVGRTSGPRLGLR